MSILGVDIGGTKTAVGVVTEDGKILESTVFPTCADRGFEVSREAVRKAIAFGVQMGESRGGISAIGICAPGPLDPRRGVMLNPPNMPGWRNIPLADEVSREFGVPCSVEKDTNGAVLAEYLYGAAQGCQHALYLTISTGIGAALLWNGQVYHGRNGVGMEAGHLTIDYRSPIANASGVRGSIEALASGLGIARRVSELLPDYPGSCLKLPATAAAVGEAIQQGDELALRIFEEIAEMLAAWLGSLVSLFDPDVVVIGGGVSQIGDPLFSRLREQVPGRSINPFAKETPIVPAILGPEVGIVGAAAVAQRRAEQANRVALRD